MSANKRKGTAFESAVVAYLQEAGFHQVERRALAGANDRGDIAGVPNWTLELKTCQSIDLAGFVDEAAREAANAGTDRYAAVVKRRRRSTACAYVVMPLSVFVQVIGGAAESPQTDTPK